MGLEEDKQDFVDGIVYRLECDDEIIQVKITEVKS